jgi:hypothetical protein
MAVPASLELTKKVVRDDTFEFPLPTPGTRPLSMHGANLISVVIPGEFFRDLVRSTGEDPFIPTQLRVSTYGTLTTLLPLDNLTYLDISHNDWLTDFPLEVVKCNGLRKLDISGCKGLVDGRLPGCLAELVNMEWLAADLCDIVAIGIHRAHSSLTSRSPSLHAPKVTAPFPQTQSTRLPTCSSRAIIPSSETHRVRRKSLLRFSSSKANTHPCRTSTKRSSPQSPSITLLPPSPTLQIGAKYSTFALENRERLTIS